VSWADRAGPGDPVELADLAQRVAVEAGDAVALRRRAGPVVALTKSSPTDMVTELDHLSETMIVAGLTAERPTDAIVGEEGTARPGTSGVEWLVDPVDGTTNLLYDLPTWSVSIAAREAGETVAAVVYAPALRHLYRAVAGRGASCNGEPVRCSSTTDLADVLLGTGFSYLAERRAEQGAVVARLLPVVRDIRRLGSAALDLCFVGAGRLDAYFERGLNPWDLAAGELVAREAGAITTDFSGSSTTSGDVVAAPPQLHPRLLALLASAIG
jgi:myo-inositol-1(or 4)-monophosphatase